MMGTKSIETASDEYTLNLPLRMEHARWLRGVVASKVDRTELHHHCSHGIVYQHPLVRFDISTGNALVSGLDAGALLLRSTPPFLEFTFGRETYPVLAHQRRSARVDIGPTAEQHGYMLKTPYLALNQENHVRWNRGSKTDRERLLERIVVGNLLSLSKAIGLNVEERLCSDVHLEPDDWHEIKPGVRLLGFRGSFRVNFQLPDLWGIGKSSARGFGTLTRVEA
jgi:hypothetical protein